MVRLTDLLDPPVVAEVTDVEPSEPGSPAPAGRDAARWLLGALLVGAGAVHLAMAPSHLGESGVEGAGFLAAAWLQLGLAVVVLARPSARWALGAVMGVNAVLVGAWVVSRTAGLPFGGHAGHAETVGFVDGATVVLEGLAILVAGMVLSGRAGALGRSTAVAIAGGFGAMALATAAIASPSAVDHASGSHGDHGAGAAAGEHAHGNEGAEDDLGFSSLSNGHQHESGVEPLTSAQMVQLAGELAVTTELMAQYPTLADAEAAGWVRSGPFSPGLGVHYRSPEFVPNPDGLMDREDLLSPMLIFDGLEPGAQLAGFMFLAYGTSSEPEGFAGPNDHWHYHEHVCITTDPVDGSIDTPFGADLEGVTEEMCTAVGGGWIANTGYMVHVWNVPGYESPDGLFTELNPAITCPDGTYHRIPTAELGGANSTCVNP